MVAPGAGSCPTTVLPLDDGITTTCTSRPRLPSSRSATSLFMPSTSGRGNERGPFDATITTVEPLSAVPEEGFWRITSPAGTLSEKRSRRCTWKPAASRTVVASPTVRPCTDGTLTGSGPALTTRCTTLPYSTRAAGAGDWRITSSFATFWLYLWDGLTTKWPGPSFARARPSGSPSTFGSGTIGAPDERW